MAQIFLLGGKSACANLNWSNQTIIHTNSTYVSYTSNNFSIDSGQCKLQYIPSNADYLFGILCSRNLSSTSNDICVFYDGRLIERINTLTNRHYSSGSYELYPFSTLDTAPVNGNTNVDYQVCFNNCASAGGGCDCVGVNVCDIKTQTKVVQGVIYGKDFDLNDVSQNITLDFTNQNSIYVGLTQEFGCITHIELFNVPNSFIGNGYISVVGKYIDLLELTFNLFGTIKDCSLGDYLGCVTGVLQSLNIAVSGLDRNVGSFEFDICELYAHFIPNLDFMNVTAQINTDDELASDYARITNFLYPQLRFDLSSGFETVTTCEDCCCDSFDSTPQSGGNGSISVTTSSGGGESGGGESGGGESGGDDCVCEWLSQINITLRNKLQMIADKLDSLIRAVSALELVCTTNVNPTPITVNPCTPYVTVNPTDLTGVISAIGGITSQLSSMNVDSDGLYCENSLGVKESIACILKSALNHSNKGLAQITNDSLNYSGESISEISKKAFSKEDDCCDTEINLIDTLVTHKDNSECENYKLAEVIKDKDCGAYVDCIIEPNELLSIRKTFKLDEDN